ncbi:MAG: SirB2 family protein [Rhodocyclaceae bacterium]|nr:SirB2 family protein [Rhodocyclaceae bacterium]
MYAAIKYLHIACVALSGAGLFLRGLLMIAASPLLQHRWVKVAPHVNDTVLLAAAIALAVMSRQFPFVEAWLTAKLFGLMGYIVLGAVALKPGRPRGVRIAAWLGALAVFAYIVSVAITKSPWGLFRAVGG